MTYNFGGGQEMREPRFGKTHPQKLDKRDSNSFVTTG